MAKDAAAMTGDGFAVRLSILYAGLFAALGIHMPFLPVWLAAKGLDAQAIGLVLAAPLVVRIVTVPLATAAADRWDALRGAIVVAAVAAPLAYVVAGLSNGLLAILVTVSLASATYTSIFPLADAYALKGLAARGRAYGPIRLWGSAAFIVGSIGAGLAADLMAPGDLIWLMVAGFCLTALAALTLHPLPPTPAAHAEARSGLGFVGSPAFVLVTAAASLIQASHAVYYGFATIAWTAAGFDGRVIGALWALGVIAEVILFAVSGRLPPSLSGTVLLLVGAAGAAARWGIMALDPSMAVLLAAQCLHAFSFGATHLGAMAFLARAAPGGRSASAQGYFTLALGFVMAGAMALSGRWYEAYGSGAYVAMAAGALVGGVCALAAQRLGRAGGGAVR
jgi:PPP family 3-phenylpropionic acid transporter